MKISMQLGMAIAVAISAGCHSREPAQGRKAPQPERVILERAKQSYTKKQYIETFILLQTLKDTWPDSPYVAQANRLVDDCRRREGCDFYLKQWEALPPGGGMIFFPSMPDTPKQRKKGHHPAKEKTGDKPQETGGSKLQKSHVHADG
ncbi:MAG TPA: hypothetical protein VI685_16445 [Candidatus Angelobacter sp.]